MQETRDDPTEASRHVGGEDATGTGRRPVTALDVARAVGVSRSAVSRAFTPGALIAEGTRRNVEAAAARLGYVPNALARMLISRRSRIVGVVMGTLTNPFRSAVLDRLSTALHANDLVPILFPVTPNSSVDALLPSIRQYQPEAVVVTGFTPTAAALQRMRDAEVRVVVLNRGHEASDAGTFVSCDHAGGGALVAQRMLAAGYRRMGVVGAGRDQVTTASREAGFAAVLHEAGLRPVRAVECPLGYEGGAAAGAGLMGRRSRPEAVFCLNDMTALGVIDAARTAHGLEPGRDYGIAGFDDIPMGAWPTYGLSSVAQPIEAMVEEVVQVVLRGGRATGASLPGRYVARRSLRGESWQFGAQGDRDPPG